jgi:hypothetical protein
MRPWFPFPGFRDRNGPHAKPDCPMTTFAPFADWLAAQQAPEDLKTVVAALAEECVAISGSLSLGALAGALGVAGSRQRPGRGAEEARRHDQRHADSTGSRPARPSRAVGSEEMPHLIELTGRQGRLLVTFDPLDGSVQYRHQRLGRDDLLRPAGPGRTRPGRGRLPDRPAGNRSAPAMRSMDPQTNAGADRVNEGVAGFTLDDEGRLAPDRRSLTFASRPTRRNLRSTCLEPPPLAPSPCIAISTSA